MVLRSIGPLSLAKIAATLYAFMGLLIGALFSMLSTTFGAFAGQMSNNPFGILFGLGAIVFLPLLYGCLGFLGGLIGAGLYNWLAGWMGGVRMEFEGAPVQPPAA